jgi:hypothetical protein
VQGNFGGFGFVVIEIRENGTTDRKALTTVGSE